jgi:uncharacterized membrane protein HdeD (DUF308 family)
MMNLSRNWWLVVVRGVLAILFGLIALFWPGLTFFLLILMFGVYAIVDGLFAIYSGVVRSRFSSRWWVFLLEGIISLAAGLIALARPGWAGVALVLVIAVWAVLTGILEIAAAIRLRREITNEWLLGFGGFVSVLLGILLFFQPLTGGLVVTLMIGVYALIFGVLLVFLGFRLRKLDVRPAANERERDVVQSTH